MCKFKDGDRIQMLESKYCGIEFARVGDYATVTGKSTIAAAFWVIFDVQPETPCMLLVEHNGVGWAVLDAFEQKITA